MVNVNGSLKKTESNDFVQNRAFLYGDAVFETIKVVKGNILFFEDHYFRLMSGMRITRMRIPQNFTMENIEAQIHRTLKSADLLDKVARVRITVYRQADGLYTPQSYDVGFVIQVSLLEKEAYEMNQSPCEVDIYKDFHITAQLLSNVKTTNRVLNVMAGIFAKENGYDNCLLLNERKMIVEAINGNVFLVRGNRLITPPLEEGCIKGVMRKQIIDAVKLIEGVQYEEAVISPFDLQKADELFITNVIQGIKPVTQYRKKAYKTEISYQLISMINQLNSLS